MGGNCFRPDSATRRIPGRTHAYPGRRARRSAYGQALSWIGRFDLCVLAGGIMISTTGIVTDIKVRQDGAADLAFVTLLDSQSGLSEQFIIWAADIGHPTPFSVWIARSLVVSLLRTALVNKL